MERFFEQIQSKPKKSNPKELLFLNICLATSYSHRGSPQLPSALKAAASDERRISSSASLVQILVWEPHSGLLSLASSTFLLLPTLALRSRRDLIKQLCSSNKNKNQKKEQLLRATLSSHLPGDVLLSQGEIPQLPSALKSLTSVFGMGTGVTSSPLSPDEYSIEGLFLQN